LRKDSLQNCYLACNYLNIDGLGLCIYDDFLTDSHIHTDLAENNGILPTMQRHKCSLA
jgi:hypothetical protein